MQAGLDTARARLDALTRRDIPPRVDIRPDAASSDFFGADGPGFRDLVDAVNPLNHLPIIGDLFASAVDHAPSTASRLVGGTLLGGPIGFVASLASVIFESTTGHSVTDTVVAALTGEDLSSSTAVAANNLPAPAAAQVSSTLPASGAPAQQTASADAVLDLFGASNTASAHQSYQKAQLLPYLDDVTVSELL